MNYSVECRMTRGCVWPWHEQPESSFPWASGPLLRAVKWKMALFFISIARNLFWLLRLPEWMLNGWCMSWHGWSRQNVLSALSGIFFSWHTHAIMDTGWWLPTANAYSTFFCLIHLGENMWCVRFLKPAARMAQILHLFDIITRAKI